MATPKVLDAYEAWHAAKRALDAAMPWTADWLRLRMIEQELRGAFESAVDEVDSATTRSRPRREPEHAPRAR